MDSGPGWWQMSSSRPKRRMTPTPLLGNSCHLGAWPGNVTLFVPQLKTFVKWLPHQVHSLTVPLLARSTIENKRKSTDFSIASRLLLASKSSTTMRSSQNCAFPFAAAVCQWMKIQWQPHQAPPSWQKQLYNPCNRHPAPNIFCPTHQNHEEPSSPSTAIKKLLSSLGTTKKSSI